MRSRRNYPRMLSSPSQAEGNYYPPGKSLRVFTKIYLPLLRNRGWGGANGGSAKPTIGYVIGSVKRFCCYKSEKLPNSFSIFVYVFGFVVKIYHYHKFILCFLEVVVRRCSVKKVFLKISQNSQENTCARVSFLIKLQVLHRCFPVNFAKFLGTPFFIEHL